MAAFSWDFGHATRPDPNNPALHQWLSTGKYRVTVTAVLGDARTGESPGTDTVTVEVTPGVHPAPAISPSTPRRSEIAATPSAAPSATQ